MRTASCSAVLERVFRIAKDNSKENEYTHIGYYHEGGELGGIANEKKLVTFVKKAWYNKKASSGIG